VQYTLLVQIMLLPDLQSDIEGEVTSPTTYIFPEHLPSAIGQKNR